MTKPGLFLWGICAVALAGFTFITTVTYARPRADQLQALTKQESETPNVNDDLAVERILSNSSAPRESAGGVFQNTGADNCNDVSVIPLPADLPGQAVPVTILGDNTSATGPDCNGDGPLWWEAFEITGCATVRLDFCGTVPKRSSVATFLYSSCPATGTDCGPRIGFTSGGPGFCGDGNFTLVFANLPAGRYYIPIKSTNASDRGPYQMHLTAEVCVGSCCDFDANSCTDNVTEELCSGANQVFSTDASCCTRECLPPGEMFRSDGVELLSWIDLTEFPDGSIGGNDVWGYTSPSGREYAIMGLNLGTGFVEVTDPFNPVIIATIPDPVSLWSDMRTFGHYAYNVVDSTGNGMQIFDLAQIDDGVVTLVDTFVGGGFQTAHNIAVNTESGFAYLCSTNIAQGFVALDLANPIAPTISGFWNQAGCHDMFVITYHTGPFAGREIAFMFGTGDHFYIIDVTDKSNMFTVSSVPQIPVGFGHQGWITEDRRFVIMGSERNTGEPTTTFVTNVKDIEAPFFVNSYTTGRCSTDHNMMIRGNLAYHADYSSGLQVFDITDPTNAQHVAFFDTHPENNNRGFDGAWGIFTQLPSGIVLLSDDVRGLFVLNYDCNGNGIDDTLDIANATSGDCNSNGLPDECERDANANGVPDACEFLSQTPLQAEPGGVDKNRFISFQVPPLNVLQQNTALRVKLTSLHHPPSPPNAPDLTAHEGEFRYVVPLAFDGAGAPLFDCVDSSTFATTFKCAGLSCDPVYLDWSGLLAGETLHVTGASVVPSSLYDVSMLSANCAGMETTCALATTDLTVATTQWGDVSADSIVNVADIVAVVDAVKDGNGAIPLYQSTMKPDDPNPMIGPRVNVVDIVLVVDAVRLVPYPYGGPTPCP